MSRFPNPRLMAAAPYFTLAAMAVLTACLMIACRLFEKRDRKECYER